MDDKLRSGEEISPALVKAIEESKISIIVLTKNYVSSQWCLDELMKILESRKTREILVLPLFYDVNPLEVRHQTNRVRDAFTELSKWFNDDEIKVVGWKRAQKEVANLSGMYLGNWNEPEFSDEIIERVNSKLVNNTYFQVAQYPIGIKSHVQDMKSLLDIENNDSTCMIGIFGTSRIGKTTLAKAIYNSIDSHYEDSCFLENIRETSNKKGLIHLQIKLISKILGGSSQMVDNVDQGITLIQQRLRLIQILLVLDDVDHSDQLEKIVGKGNWFGLRSRIIITTRDRHLLTKHQVLSYEVKELGYFKAHKLFSWHAFNRDRPDDDYVKVINDAMCYARGLPLPLQVLGSSLKGENVEYVTKIVDSCGFHSYSGIEELKDKCLIAEFSDKSLVMHELLQEMDREIIR
ncbi:disease resistance protein RUN1-like [Corylus avellana]|uniref:disease resistance protein RUN1-like n=1 Tax=Corylus avellana TaxID=13451 RepID=UPI00286B4C0E|nr:disease resistance protein RUN1-like [Corylus avellana]